MAKYDSEVQITLPFRNGGIQNPTIEDDAIAIRLLLGVREYVDKKYPKICFDEMSVLEFENLFFDNTPPFAVRVKCPKIDSTKKINATLARNVSSFGTISLIISIISLILAIISLVLVCN